MSRARTRRLETFTALAATSQDLDGLVEMAGEDESLEGEVEEQIASVELDWRIWRSSGCSPAHTTRATHW